MRIAIVIDCNGALKTTKLKARCSTFLGERTIFRHNLEEIEDSSDFARVKSYVGTIAPRAVLVCQPNDGSRRVIDARMKVSSWLDGLAAQGIYCRHCDYDPRGKSVDDIVLKAIEDFPVKYSKSIEQMMDSSKLLTTTETAQILSEYWREIAPRDVRRLRGLQREKSGERRLGYREYAVANFIKDNC